MPLSAEFSEVFGYPDDLKFASCMTLFSQLDQDESLSHRALEKYFDGACDNRSLELLDT